MFASRYLVTPLSLSFFFRSLAPVSQVGVYFGRKYFSGRRGGVHLARLRGLLVSSPLSSPPLPHTLAVLSFHLPLILSSSSHLMRFLSAWSLFCTLQGCLMTSSRTLFRIKGETNVWPRERERERERGRVEGQELEREREREGSSRAIQ